MATATLKETTQKFGLRMTDIVKYQKKGKKILIEVELDEEKKAETVFDFVVANSVEVGISDWSENHDHYLYGTPKRKKK